MLIEVKALQDLLENISKNNLEETFLVAEKLMDSSKYYNDIIHQKARYFRVKEDYTKGSITYDEYEVTVNRIQMAFIKIVEAIMDDNELRKFDLKKIKYVIGLDLGDGESSISFIEHKSEMRKPPIVFEQEGRNPSIITVLVPQNINRRRKGQIGEKALLYYRSGDIIVHNFKTNPNSESFASTRSAAAEFVEIFYSQLILAHKELNSTNSIIFIGAPASWSPNERKKYAEIFLPSNCLPAVKVVSESRAALIHVKDSNDLTSEQLEGRVMVIDIGSSTTDFTLMNNLIVEDLPEFGKDFGCRKIDEAIVEFIIDKSNNGEYFDEFSQKVDSQFGYLTLLCRKYKEKSFGKNVQIEVPEEDDLRVIYQKYSQILEKIDSEQIKGLSITDAGDTWGDQFRALLVDVKNHIIYEPDVVVVTGGGSRMPFVVDIVRDVFEASYIPDSTNFKFSDPSLTITNGLARYGRWQFNIIQFYRDVELFCESSDLDECIKAGLQPFTEALSKVYVENLHKEVLLPLLIELRDKKVDTSKIDDFRYFFLNRFTAWLDSDKGKISKDKINTAFQSTFNPLLEKHTSRIEKSNNIPEGKFETHFYLTKEILSSEPGIERAVNVLIGKILQFLDVYVPGWARGMASNQILKIWMMVEKWVFKNLTSVILKALDESYSVIGLNDKRKKIFIEVIKKEIKKQLFAKAASVEKYLE